MSENEESRRLRAFAEGLLSPERNGYAVSPFIRDEARRALGLRACETAPPTPAAEAPEDSRLPDVAGRRSTMSNADIERACLAHIGRQQKGHGPFDSAMLATFCEAVRMAREYSDFAMARGTEGAFPASRGKSAAASAGGGDQPRESMAAEGGA